MAANLVPHPSQIPETAQIGQGDEDADGPVLDAATKMMAVIRPMSQSMGDYGHIDDPAERAHLSQQLDSMLKQVETMVVQRLATKVAVQAVRAEAKQPREKLYGASPNFEQIYKKAYDAAQANPSALYSRDKRFAAILKTIGDVRAVLSSKDDEIQATQGAAGGQGKKFICPITKTTMKKPMRTPCGHVFSYDGLKMVSSGKDTFNCPQVSQSLDWVCALRRAPQLHCRLSSSL